MAAEIDQSIKIEQTSGDTVIALSDKKKFVLVLPRGDKKAIQRIFRERGETRLFVYFVFAALVVIVIFRSKVRERITIDREYWGNEDIIKLKIKDFLERLHLDLFDLVEFGLVGKNSPAHILASEVATKKRKADKIVSREEILRLVFPEKKDRVSRKGPRAA